jgi:acid phosphatase (class A)
MRLTLSAAIAVAVLALVPGLAADGPQPYLAPSDTPDAAKFLPDFPAKSSKAKAEDQYVFDLWRKKQADPRWSEAIADADWHTTAVLAGFTCALGVKLDQTNAPKLIALIERAQEDLANASGNAKKFFHRDRPFVGTTKATCVGRETVGNSYAYPSGHSALGWMTALLLTELAPERAGELMARGRAYGESRAVCGMHWESDVETGRYVGAAVIAALHSSAAFRADMETARAEVAAARTTAGATDSPTCQMANNGDEKRPW